MHGPRLLPVGDRALLVEFADALDEGAEAAVRALDQALAAAPPSGFLEAVPAYVSLLVAFDPLVTDHAAIAAAVDAALATPPLPAAEGPVRAVPVCYDGDFGRDLSAVAAATGLAVDAVIAAHLAGDYRVAMYGFAPGYAYLGGVPEAIRLPRKPAPVRAVPAGSVIVAGPQCLITTLTMPTGWWVLGRSPLAVLTGDPDRPFLFEVGERLRFTRVDRSTYEQICREAP